MRIEFRAIDAGFDADEYSIICGVNGQDALGVEHALSFDRLSEEAAAQDPEDDWGVHTEFDDQSNGEYGCVRQCRLSRTALAVDLQSQLGRLANVEGFDVELAISSELFEMIRIGLTRIFRDMPGVLVVGNPIAAFAFSEPWHPCDDARFEKELARELCEKHVLYGVPAKIVARRQDLDDFLFELPDGRFANVHLTWSRESNPTWPSTEIYDSVEQMRSEIQQHIDEWNELEGT
jgi:hypothetical protein